MEVRRALPDHPVPESVRSRGNSVALVVDGLVERPAVLLPEDLDGLARIELVETFTCEEGWQVPDLTWRGVPLRDVLAFASPRPAAAWVRVSAGTFTVPLTLAEAKPAIVAEELNGQRLNASHGGPWRLVVPGAACFTSVKWVDHLELASEPGERSGEALARSRLTGTR